MKQKFFNELAQSYLKKYIFAHYWYELKWSSNDIAILYFIININYLTIKSTIKQKPLIKHGKTSIFYPKNGIKNATFFCFLCCFLLKLSYNFYF